MWTPRTFIVYYSSARLQIHWRQMDDLHHLFHITFVSIMLEFLTSWETWRIFNIHHSLFIIDVWPWKIPIDHTFFKKSSDYYWLLIIWYWSWMSIALLLTFFSPRLCCIYLFVFHLCRVCEEKYQKDVRDSRPHSGASAASANVSWKIRLAWLALPATLSSWTARLNCV